MPRRSTGAKQPTPFVTGSQYCPAAHPVCAAALQTGPLELLLLHATARPSTLTA